MNTINNIGLITTSAAVTRSMLDQAAVAIQAQVNTLEFGLWNVTGHVTTFDNIDAVIDAKYMPVYVQDNIYHPGMDGFHICYTDGGSEAPYAVVSSKGDWSLTLSHECLELMVDPTGKHLWSAPCLDGSGDLVDYLVEVCDASPLASHLSDNGVLVSDFYLPSYFDMEAALTEKFSFYDSLTRPLSLANGGYICWKSGDNWYRADRFNGQANPTIQQVQPVDLGGSYREWIDYSTKEQMDRVRTRFKPRTRLKRKSGVKASRQNIYKHHQTWLKKRLNTLGKTKKTTERSERRDKRQRN